MKKCRAVVVLSFAILAIAPVTFATSTEAIPDQPVADSDAAPLPPIDPAAIAAAAAEPFPTPAALGEEVAFWKKVWSEWSMSQVILHDDLHPQVVYEIVDLPGPIGETYSETQRDLIKARRELLQSRLAVIEAKLIATEPLDDDEKSLALTIATGAGTAAIEGSHDRVRSQRGLKERFLRGVEISSRYLPRFKQIFKDAGLPEDLAYLPHVESSFQHDARSKAGAVGMWQFTRPAAKLFMTMTSAIDERLDPVAAARGASRYMKRAFDQLASWPLAVTSYNHGIAGMRQAKERFGTDFEAIVSSFDGKYFGFASRNFYTSFIAARDLAKSYEVAPPEVFAPEPPLQLDHVKLDAPATPALLAQRYRVAKPELVALNRAWTKKALNGQSKIPAGVYVWLPEGTLDRLAARANGKPAPPPAVLSAAAKVHTVTRGESLSGIARQYGIPLTELLTQNNLRKDSVVHPGQRLRIP